MARRSAEATKRFVDLPFFRDGIRLRTRFLDDSVRDGLAAGLDQVVLLGAGFDARGLRMREIGERRARVFEVDTPYQMDRKRRTLTGAGIKLPAHVVYVPFDFATPELDTELGGALEIAGFRRGAGAMFVWEGVVGYIDNAAIDQSLRFMASAGGQGSRVAFTFADEAFLGDEPMAGRTKRCGFASCEAIGSDALWRRYLPGDPHPDAWLTKVGWPPHEGRDSRSRRPAHPDGAALGGLALRTTSAGPSYRAPPSTEPAKRHPCRPT